MKTLMIYASTHHGNTKQVAERIAARLDADLYDAGKDALPAPSGYDLVGLASGIYFHSFQESVQKYARTASFRPGQKVFLVDTCGVGYRDYTSGMRKLLEQRGVQVIGKFQCRGYDTYGVFGKLGGIAKGHPSAADLDHAGQFAQEMLTLAGGQEA